jgi:hypothetical protein
VELLRERLAAAERESADLAHLRAVNAQLVATVATLSETLAREQQRRMPWQAISEPVEPTQRRWWQWWRNG